jgi:hypothetical protein
LLSKGSLFEGGEADKKKMEDEKKEDEEPEYNHSIAYPCAILSALFFGVGNFILIMVGYEEGIKTFFPQCIAAAALFLLYHICAWLWHLCSEGGCMSHFTKERSAYWLDETNELSFWALM